MGSLGLSRGRSACVFPHTLNLETSTHLPLHDMTGVLKEWVDWEQPLPLWSYSKYVFQEERLVDGRNGGGGGKAWG